MTKPKIAYPGTGSLSTIQWADARANASSTDELRALVEEAERTMRNLEERRAHRVEFDDARARANASTYLRALRWHLTARTSQTQES